MHKRLFELVDFRYMTYEHEISKKVFLTLIVHHDFDVILHRLRRFQNNLKYLKCFIFYIFNVKKSLHGNISKLHTKDKKKTLSCILISI